MGQIQSSPHPYFGVEQYRIIGAAGWEKSPSQNQGEQPAGMKQIDAWEICYIFSLAMAVNRHDSGLFFPQASSTCLYRLPQLKENKFSSDLKSVLTAHIVHLHQQSAGAELEATGMEGRKRKSGTIPQSAECWKNQKLCRGAHIIQQSGWFGFPPPIFTSKMTGKHNMC